MSRNEQNLTRCGICGICGSENVEIFDGYSDYDEQSGRGYTTRMQSLCRDCGAVYTREMYYSGEPEPDGEWAPKHPAWG